MVGAFFALFLSAAAWLVAGPGRAEEARVLIGSIAAASETGADDPDAAASPVARAAKALMDRLGYRRPPELLPFVRAVVEVQKHDDAVMLPLARTPKRESEYQWLVPLWEDDCVIVTLRGLDIDAKNLGSARIGVVRASATQEVAEQLGYTNLELSTDDIQNLQKLRRGRIEAWFGLRQRVDRAIALLRLDPAEFHISASLSPLKIYVAASKSFDSKEAERWKAAGDGLLAEGVMASLLRDGPL